MSRELRLLRWLPDQVRDFPGVVRRPGLRGPVREPGPGDTSMVLFSKATALGYQQTRHLAWNREEGGERARRTTNWSCHAGERRESGRRRSLSPKTNQKRQQNKSTKSNRSNPTDLDTIESVESELPERSCHIAALRNGYGDSLTYGRTFPSDRVDLLMHRRSP